MNLYVLYTSVGILYVLAPDSPTALKWFRKVCPDLRETPQWGLAVDVPKGTYVATVDP